ncbi:MAG: hypothetical protein ACOC0C_01485 [Bacteroidota bacterium]
MKKITLLLLMIVTSLYVSAQSYVPTADDLEHFRSTKTMIVMEENPMLEYNLIIKEVIEAEWKITDYEFVSYKDFDEKLRFNPDLSFLVMTQVSFEKDKTGARYKFLHVLLGGDVLEVRQMKEICSVPLAYRNVEEGNYIYKLRTLLRFVQNHIELITKDPSIIDANVFKYYNNNVKDIRNKTLYLVKDELSSEINTIAKIKKVYPYKFKLSTREEIEQLIIDRDPDVVFLHKVGPEGTHLKARCYKVIIGASDANFYYFDYHMIDNKKPDGLLEKDLKRMAKGK